MKFEPLAGGFKFMEGGRVDATNRVYFSDVTQGKIYRYSTKMDVLLSAEGVGGIALNDDGRLVHSGQNGLWISDPVSRIELALLQQVNGTKVYTNDIEPDGFGGLYGGTIDLPSRFKGEPPRYGELFHLDADGTLTILQKGVVGSNGIGISPDRKTLYHSDSGTGIWAYDLVNKREIANRRLLVQMQDSDGLAVDADGHLWVAAWQSGAVVRYDARGALRERYEMAPGVQVTTLTFGGTDLRDLYVFTGSDILNPSAEPKASLYVARSDVAGQPLRLTAFRLGS